MLAAIAGAVLFMHLGPQVLAKSGQQPEAKLVAKEAANIDPEAVDAVKKNGRLSAIVEVLPGDRRCHAR